MTAARATVGVRFGAPKPKTPTPVDLVAVSGDENVPVSWTPGSDRGRPVTAYEVEARDSGGRVLAQFATRPGEPTRGVLAVGRNGVVVTVRARAWNDLGASAWTTTKVTPAVQVPDVRILSPAARTVVTGSTLRVVVSATPHRLSRQPISRVEVVLGSSSLAAIPNRDGTWVATFDLTDVHEDGRLAVRATATDQHRRESSAATSVMIAQRLSAPRILQPADDPAIWDGDTFTVHVDPGVDRLTGTAPETVVVDVVFARRYATAANNWTITVDRGALRSPGGGFMEPTTMWVTSETWSLRSDTVSRLITVR